MEPIVERYHSDAKFKELTLIIVFALSELETRHKISDIYEASMMAACLYKQGNDQMEVC